MTIKQQRITVLSIWFFISYLFLICVWTWDNVEVCIRWFLTAIVLTLLVYPLAYIYFWRRGDY